MTLALYEKEIANIASEKSRLQKAVQGGYDRNLAIKELDALMEETDAYDFFRGIYTRSVTDYLSAQGIDVQPGLQLPGVRVHGQDGIIEDIELDISYPVVVLEKQAPSGTKVLPFPAQEFTAV